MKVHGEEEGRTPAAAECDAQTQGLKASRVRVPKESVPRPGPPEEWSPLSGVHSNRRAPGLAEPLARAAEVHAAAMTGARKGASHCYRGGS